MKTGQGKVEEILLDGSARILCPTDLIPIPGQYLIAHKNASETPLPVSLFFMDSTPNGFRSAPPIPKDWQPGDSLTFRGPIGHGFNIPPSTQKIALITLDDSYARLHGLISLALKQQAEIVLVSQSAQIDLPEVIEVQPLQALTEVLKWADYAAFDIQREKMNQLKEILKEQNQITPKVEAQILIHTSMPCGGVAECGVCALTLGHDWKMICKEGPVFDLSDVL